MIRQPPLLSPAFQGASRDVVQPGDVVRLDETRLLGGLQFEGREMIPDLLKPGDQDIELLS